MIRTTPITRDERQHPVGNTAGYRREDRRKRGRSGHPGDDVRDDLEELDREEGQHDTGQDAQDQRQEAVPNN